MFKGRYILGGVDYGSVAYIVVKKGAYSGGKGGVLGGSHI